MISGDREERERWYRDLENKEGLRRARRNNPKKSKKKKKRNLRKGELREREERNEEARLRRRGLLPSFIPGGLCNGR